MPRIARVVAPHCPHHVTHRGNHRMDIFRRPEDREIYRSLLKRYSQEYGLRIWSYSLMGNHIHLVAVPDDEQSMSATMRDAHGAYATVFNRVYEKVGHLWESRYFSCVTDEVHLWNAIRYVERNPVRAGLVERAEDYKWSSAAAHCGLRQDPILSDDLPLLGVVTDWSAWLSGTELPDDLKRIRRNTNTGRPCGSKEFIEQLEKQLGRNLLPRKRGPNSRTQPEGGAQKTVSETLKLFE